ncbi:MAG: hypothetical protein HQL76_06785 [Magnetococcales bacterium]|nr:hypothetical protein [Magnetococcales bacterium]
MSNTFKVICPVAWPVQLEISEIKERKIDFGYGQRVQGIPVSAGVTLAATGMKREEEGGG